MGLIWLPCWPMQLHVRAHLPLTTLYSHRAPPPPPPPKHVAPHHLRHLHYHHPHHMTWLPSCAPPRYFMPRHIGRMRV